MGAARIGVDLLVDTPSHAASVFDAISSDVSARPKFGDRVENLLITNRDDGRAEVRLDVRFTSRAERDAFRDWLLGEIRDHPTVRTWIDAARVTAHWCTHDEVQAGSCLGTEFLTVFEKGDVSGLL